MSTHEALKKKQTEDLRHSEGSKNIRDKSDFGGCKSGTATKSAVRHLLQITVRSGGHRGLRTTASADAANPGRQAGRKAGKDSQR